MNIFFIKKYPFREEILKILSVCDYIFTKNINKNNTIVSLRWVWIKLDLDNIETNEEKKAIILMKNLIKKDFDLLRMENRKRKFKIYGRQILVYNSSFNNEKVSIDDKIHGLYEFIENYNSNLKEPINYIERALIKNMISSIFISLDKRMKEEMENGVF